MRVKDESNGIGLGIVETQYFTFGHTPGDMLELESGRRFGPVTLAYETYGELNREKSNAILIQHTLTSDAHAAGFHHGDKRPGLLNVIIFSGIRWSDFAPIYLP